MGENGYFREALSDFAFDAAYGDSIRHLHNSGYTVKQIKEYLGAEALTEKRISEVIDRYNGSGSDTESTPKSNNGCDYEIVREYDPYGRPSFVRKKKENLD